MFSVEPIDPANIRQPFWLIRLKNFGCFFDVVRIHLPRCVGIGEGGFTCLVDDRGGANGSSNIKKQFILTKKTINYTNKYGQWHFYSDILCRWVGTTLDGNLRNQCTSNTIIKQNKLKNVPIYQTRLIEAWGTIFNCFTFTLRRLREFHVIYQISDGERGATWRVNGDNLEKSLNALRKRLEPTVKQTVWSQVVSYWVPEMWNALTCGRAPTLVRRVLGLSAVQFLPACQVFGKLHVFSGIERGCRGRTDVLLGLRLNRTSPSRGRFYLATGWRGESGGRDRGCPVPNDTTLICLGRCLIPEGTIIIF